MNICLVTSFPPSRHPLNEYGFHIARELSQKSGITLTILADDLPSSEPELPEYAVVRCWSFDGLNNPVRLLSAIRKIRADVVWYNLGLASFASRPLPAFLSLVTPALTRLRGHYTHVTLHQLMETVDLKDAGIRTPRLYQLAGTLATHLLLSANSLSVLLPAYRRILWERYARGVVSVRPHGVLLGRPEAPEFSQRGNPVHRVLAFGKWGTYKRLDLLIAAFRIVAADFPEVELLIAGQDHPKAPGYMASAKRRFSADRRIRFLGYISESDIPALFQSASIAVMPYSSSAGSSGVAHLACAYGVPIVASNIPDFHELVDEEGLAIEFFEPGNIQNLAERISMLLQTPSTMHAMGEQNFAAALRMSMPQIIEQYLRSFELQHRIKTLKAAARARGTPKWLPWRSALSAGVANKFQSWNVPDDETQLSSRVSSDDSRGLLPFERRVQD